MTIKTFEADLHERTLTERVLQRLTERAALSTVHGFARLEPGGIRCLICRFSALF